MAYLILVRHGITDWNKAGKWQGFTDISLNAEGEQQARNVAQSIKNIKIDQAYTSDLVRTQQTYQQICDTLGLSCPVIHNAALNERDYGTYTGKNKWEVQKEIGDEEFQKLRRSFDYPVPGGESLKDVYDRAIPYYEQNILNDLKAGKNVLVISSNNTLRALVKYLEGMSDEVLQKFEFGLGDAYIYEVDAEGKIINKEVRAQGLSGKY